MNKNYSEMIFESENLLNSLADESFWLLIYIKNIWLIKV